MYCNRKSGFLKKKNLKMAGNPNFFHRKFVQLNLFLRRSLKNRGVSVTSMFKMPDFPLAPCLCKQAGSDLCFCMELERSRYPRTLVSGTLWETFAIFPVPIVSTVAVRQAEQVAAIHVLATITFFRVCHGAGRLLSARCCSGGRVESPASNTESEEQFESNV